MPSLNNPNHLFDIYGESGSDVKHIEDFSKGEDKKNSKEYDYTNTDVKKKESKPTYKKQKLHNIITVSQEKKVKMRKLWSRKKWGWDTSKKTFL